MLEYNEGQRGGSPRMTGKNEWGCVACKDRREYVADQKGVWLNRNGSGNAPLVEYHLGPAPDLSSWGVIDIGLAPGIAEQSKDWNG